MKEKIKEAWEVFVRLARSRMFIFVYPCAALTVLCFTPPRLLPFIFLAVWVLAVMVNTDEETR